MDWFADLHGQSTSSKLVKVGGLAERCEGHPCGVDMFIEIGSLNNSRMTLAPLRAKFETREIDPHEVTNRITNVKRVRLAHVILSF